MTPSAGWSSLCTEAFPKAQVVTVLKAFARCKVSSDFADFETTHCVGTAPIITAQGQLKTFAEQFQTDDAASSSLSFVNRSLWSVEKVAIKGTTAWSLFRVKEQVAAESGELIVTYTVILYLHDETWRIVHAQQSIGVPASQLEELDGTTFSPLSRTPHLRSGSSAGSGKGTMFSIPQDHLEEV